MTLRFAFRTELGDGTERSGSARGAGFWKDRLDDPEELTMSPTNPALPD
jgi:hypothetical protein